MKMKTLDFSDIIETAWNAYNPSRKIKSITDVSAKVSTNHVYKILFTDDSYLLTKLSYFGKYENFMEDHNIINVMANNLEEPYDNFLSHTLMKGEKIFNYRHQDHKLDLWLVFYRPVKIKNLLPKKLDEKQIIILGQELAKFHKACHKMRRVLPQSSKTLLSDIHHLYRILESESGKYEYRGNVEVILEQCDIFLENIEKFEYSNFSMIPVFIDWNIGNFSVRDNGSFFSRWDYDWFRVSSRVMDFYFFSRVVSEQGDQTVFSYTISQLNEDRFLLFLKEYHKIFPLSVNEIRFIREAYRFFLLNYVIKDGKYFYNEIYASKLQQEAIQIHFPSIEKGFDEYKILKALNLS